MHREASASFAEAEESVLNEKTHIGRRKIPALTGIRGYAACWVLFFHAGFLGAQHSSGAGIDTIFGIRSGYLGVDLFFILSGYVLFLTYGAQLKPLTATGLRKFAIGRVWRILPLHWFVLGLFLAFTPLLGRYAPPAQGAGAVSFVAVALLLQIVLHVSSAWNPPSWSLSAEWVSYLAFPLAVGVFGRLRDHRLCLAGVAAGYLLLSAMCLFSTIPGLNHAQGLGLARCLVEFPAGMLLCRYVELREVDTGRANRLAVTGLALLGLSLLGPGFDLAALPGFSCLIVSSAKESGLTRRLFGNRIAVFLGDISFSIYLLHVLALQLFLANVPDLPATIFVMALFAVSSLVLPLSWISWRLLEVPAMAYGRVRARRAAA